MAGRSISRSIGWPMTDMIDRKVDEPSDRLNDGLLGYAIDRAIEKGPRLGWVYGNCQVFKSA